jgi:hypothetical protein
MLIGLSVTYQSTALQSEIASMHFDPSYSMEDFVATHPDRMSLGNMGLALYRTLEQYEYERNHYR